MCNPTAILGAQALGTGMSAMGAYGEARAQKSALRYDARMADFNAQMAEQRAAVAMEQGQFQMNQVRRLVAGTKGTARQKMARGGVDLTTGLPAEVLDSIDVLGELDAQQVRVNAVREAWGYRAQAENERARGRMARGTARGISPGMAAATTLLGGASSWAGSYYGFKRQGAFG